jgi:hypothetical protein
MLRPTNQIYTHLQFRVQYVAQARRVANHADFPGIGVIPA